MIRCIAIDPGSSSNMGLSVMDYDPLTDVFEVPHVLTARLNVYALPLTDIEQQFGERAARLEAMYRFVKDMVEAWKPAFVVSEQAHFRRGRFGAGNVIAFASLTEVNAILRKAVMDANANATFFQIPASVVKSSVNVKGNSNDKSLMTDAVKRLGLYPASQDLSEHAVDSLAIGYAQLRLLYPPLLPKVPLWTSPVLPSQ